MPTTVEVLVYSVSHIDVILSLGGLPASKDVGHFGPADEEFARPKFSQFQPVSLEILRSLRKDEPETESTIMACDSGSSSDDDDEDEQQDHDEEDMQQDYDVQVPIGMRFKHPVPWASNGDFQIRGGKSFRSSSKPEIRVVYLPMLSQILPLWSGLAESSNSESPKGDASPNASPILFPAKDTKYVIFLLSGAGRPRNKEHSVMGNSTSGTAEIMKEFIERHYPHVQVCLLDSVIGVFHYDENVKFVRQRVLPEIEILRHGLAQKHGDTWKRHLRVTIALTDGAPARLAAINASLRMYRPSYLHLWQLKTFWHEKRLIASDLQWQSFENIETKPCVKVEELDEKTRMLVKEMIKHKQQFEAVRDKQGPDTHELGNFWLRKTKKPVLSVLMVQKGDDAEPQFFRGMNVEVSMPTGSLCSERNVIGTALANDQNLRRIDLRMIAVLSMSLDKKGETKRKQSSESLRPGLSRQGSGSSRRPRTLSGMSTLSISDHNELNPISPCGACEEWLKKIAEVNPDFKVITFPNSNCEEAFISETF